uniref:Uncharacterized protein n=1 Tax=Chromera velia CCMP2878 TaxID=1169474 RepID=A0A0G4H5G0_9ALVE|eukprot:Cvel_5729.t1-p1 / transcript=Cvel_5729.t1 / gene=Cvel_5729 / organism=Chromera_velia_CCMP2878 / gene_product=hypothetical protein / transcript_product=hypothetical protein / location=Cvel_scaffold271:86329-87036(+) / protein_length=141 / sequence_SO=supercontig / SO=protein_coding / is_pseudo=false
MQIRIHRLCKCCPQISFASRLFTVGVWGGRRRECPYSPVCMQTTALCACGLLRVRAFGVMECMLLFDFQLIERELDKTGGTVGVEEDEGTRRTDEARRKEGETRRRRKEREATDEMRMRKRERMDREKEGVREALQSSGAN